MEKRGLEVIFCSKDLRLVPKTRAPKEHFKLVFGSGTSSPAKIRPLKVWDLLDFPLGSALWNFASAKRRSRALNEATYGISKSRTLVRSMDEFLGVLW